LHFQEGHNPYTDMFGYELRLDRLQPARGSFQVLIDPDAGLEPVVQSSGAQWAPGTGFWGDEPGDDNLLERRRLGSTKKPVLTPYPSPEMVHDHAVVLYLALPVFFAALVVIVVRRVTFDTRIMFLYSYLEH